MEFCRLDLMNLCCNDRRSDSVELPSEFHRRRFHEVLVISDTAALWGLALLWNGFHYAERVLRMGTLTQMSIRAASDLLENHYGGLRNQMKKLMY